MKVQSEFREDSETLFPATWQFLALGKKQTEGCYLLISNPITIALREERN
jgi:hypothetical protein